MANLITTSSEIHLRQIQTQLSLLKDWYLGADKFYWSTLPLKSKIPRSNSLIQIASFSSLDWLAFIFSRPHKGTISLFQQLPQCDRYFHKQRFNVHKQFACWCIAGYQGDAIIKRLHEFEDLSVEYIVPDKNQFPQIPPRFAPWNLTFYPKGVPC